MPGLKIRNVALEVLRVYTSLVVYIVRYRVPGAVIELVLREHAGLA